MFLGLGVLILIAGIAWHIFMDPGPGFSWAYILGFIGLPSAVVGGVLAFLAAIYSPQPWRRPKKPKPTSGAADTASKG